MSAAVPGKLIGRGRRADIYDLGGGKVLRRYREGPREVDREAEVMIHAAAHGVPVPEVFEVRGTTDLVMEAVSGPTMLADLTRRPWTVFSHARTLRRLHQAVHAVEGLAWLRGPFGPGGSLLHLDLHPENVVMTGAGPKIIDWEGAAKGPPDADVALTWILMRFSEIPGAALQRVMGRLGQALFSQLFLAGASPRPTSEWLVAAAEFRMADPTVTRRESERLAEFAHHRQRT